MQEKLIKLFINLPEEKEGGESKREKQILQTILREIVNKVLELEPGQKLKPDARALLLTKLRGFHTKEKEYKTTNFRKFLKTSKLGGGSHVCCLILYFELA